MPKDTPEERLRQAIMKNDRWNRKPKKHSGGLENEFYLELCLANGADLKIVDWPEYHVTSLNIDKNNPNVREQVLYTLKSYFNDYKVIGSSLGDHSTQRAIIYDYSKFIVFAYLTKVWFYAPSLDTITKIESLVKEFALKSDKTVYLLTSAMEGVTLTPSKCINEPLIYENYTKEVAEGLKKALLWCQSKKPQGRILIMSGPPGTGKSFAIRGLVSESTGVDWALIPSYLVPELASPNIITSLIHERMDPDRPLNLIIEDADSLLKRREETNPDIISQVLNLGDGILGELVNVKLILTTNCPRVNMDEAITRRGRLNSFIDFSLLSKEQAEIIYKKISNKEIIYDSSKALCDIYADANNQEVILPKKELLGQYL